MPFCSGLLKPADQGREIVQNKCHVGIGIDSSSVCRAWKGLLLAAFFNMQSDFYYELFSNFMGKGDKESFAHALRAAQTSYEIGRAHV